MEDCGTTSEVEGTTDFRCVQCGFPIKTLYIQYSPGNIRLMKCGYCKAVADDYIECEVMILIIDLILHKPKAFRHLFYNMFSKGTVNYEDLLWKSVLAYLLLDIYRIWVLSTNEREQPLPVRVAPLLLEFTKEVSECISWIFRMETNIARTPPFKLLQDLSHGHDGLGISFICDLYH